MPAVLTEADGAADEVADHVSVANEQLARVALPGASEVAAKGAIGPVPAAYDHLVRDGREFLPVAPGHRGKAFAQQV